MSGIRIESDGHFRTTRVLADTGVDITRQIHCTEAVIRVSDRAVSATLEIRAPKIGFHIKQQDIEVVFDRQVSDEALDLVQKAINAQRQANLREREALQVRCQQKGTGQI